MHGHAEPGAGSPGGAGRGLCAAAVGGFPGEDGDANVGGRGLLCVARVISYMRVSSRGFLVDVRPLIQTEDDVKYAAVAGASVSLHCEFFASPEATVSW